MTSLAVSYGSVTRPAGHIRCGSIHSHAELGAYPSHTDCNDELDEDGLHVVIGDFGKAALSMSAAFAVAGRRFAVDLKDVLEPFDARGLRARSAGRMACRVDDRVRGWRASAALSLARRNRGVSAAATRCALRRHRAIATRGWGERGVAVMTGGPALDRVVVIGLGGIGGWLLRLLMPFLHSRREPVTVLAIDGDAFEHRNLARMAFDEIGPKADVLCDELASIYEGVVNLIPVAVYMDRTNVGELIGEGDVVFCQPDNHATRRLVDERCAALADVTLFCCGNDGANDPSGGTFGNLQAYLRMGGRDVTNRITRFHPEIADAVDLLPSEAGCGAAAVDNPQIVFTNASVAAASLGAFYAWLTGRLSYEECYLDIVAGRMTPAAREVARK